MAHCFIWGSYSSLLKCTCLGGGHNYALTFMSLLMSLHIYIYLRVWLMAVFTAPCDCELGVEIEILWPSTPPSREEEYNTTNNSKQTYKDGYYISYVSVNLIDNSLPQRLPSLNSIPWFLLFNDIFIWYNIDRNIWELRDYTTDLHRILSSPWKALFSMFF